MDATTLKTPRTFLLNGKAAILSHFTSLDSTITSHPLPGKDKNGLPTAVGGSLAAKVPRSTYPLIPALFRAALEGIYSRLPPPLSPTPAPTPTPAPIRTSIAEALGFTTTAPFTAVLEAVLTAPTDFSSAHGQDYSQMIKTLPPPPSVDMNTLHTWSETTTS